MATEKAKKNYTIKNAKSSNTPKTGPREHKAHLVPMRKPKKKMLSKQYRMKSPNKYKTEVSLEEREILKRLGWVDCK